MRIAFVGKGGSGKSTLSSIFGSFLSMQSDKKVLLFDADLNIHIPELLLGKKIPASNHLSKTENRDLIFKWLLGTNKNISLRELKKTTTPTKYSNIINHESFEKSPLDSLTIKSNNINVLAVGTYEEGDIGASCYHNNLSVLETILNHLDDKNLFVIADMVAGIDSFAGTMHAQFDMTVLIVEPTKRSVEVFLQYLPLAREAGVDDTLYVIGNKIQTDKDIQFIIDNVPSEKLLGLFRNDENLKEIDKTGDVLKFDNISEENKSVIKNIYEKFSKLPDSRNVRLNKVRSLHKKYVSQGYIVNTHGDLTDQIDPDFLFN